MKKFIELFFMAVMVFAVVAIGLFTVSSNSYKKGYADGKAEAQTPAFIVETCSAWWFGSNKEATKVLKTYCEMKK